MESTNLIELLTQRAHDFQDKMAFTALKNGKDIDREITFAGLHERAQAIAATLQEKNLEGQAVILLYPPGLDFVEAFFGCIYANVTAVPAVPPRSRGNLPNLDAILADSNAKTILSCNSLSTKLESLFLEHENKNSYQIVTTDDIDSSLKSSWTKPDVSGDSIAFMQYTSGSTSKPKGAVIKHKNVLHNQKVSYSYLKININDKFFTWLPHYHDMGLIGTILYPLGHGVSCVMMAPAAFVKKPYSWLEAISEHKCTISGGPNFAYQLCVDRVTDEQAESLDLSSWKVAFNGAEPVREQTLKQFTKRFSKRGFSDKAFLPCYGMAESTLIITGTMRNEAPVSMTIDRNLYTHGTIVEVPEESDNSLTIVSSGRVNELTDVVIVNHNNGQLCNKQQVGEILISGESIFEGYYQKDDNSKVFSIILNNGQEKSFFHTGDLGFISEDSELYITGRIKDLIILSGKNHYPQDIELVAINSHPDLAADGCAVFSVEKNNQEQVVIACELRRECVSQYDIKDIATAVCSSITDIFEINVSEIILLKPGRVLKTSSGKIRRSSMKSSHLANTLNSIETWQAASSDTLVEEPSQENIEDTEDLDSIKDWVAERVSYYLNLERESLDYDEPLAMYGMDSTISLQLVGDLSTQLSEEADPTLLWEHPTINSLCEKVFDLLNEEAIV